MLLDERDGGMHPMLTDFGIARLADSPGLTRTHEFVGTPAYVAPESAEGRPQTSAVDIYGAGILLYELVTGRPPFAGGTALEVLHRHLSEEPRAPQHRPGAAVDGHRALPAQGPRRAAQRREPRPRAAHRRAPASACTRTRRRSPAAEGVGALLAPDPAPAAGPGDPGRAPTRPRCCRAHAGSYDPAAADQRHAADRRRPGRGQRRPDRVMPPGPAAPRRRRRGPDEPHPWQNQLRAARDRNEQTQVQYLDPSQDPLRRRPQRQQPPQDRSSRQRQQPQRAQQYPPQQQPQRCQQPPQR